MLISKSNDCSRCGSGHENQCFVTYENGWYCFSCGASYTTDPNYYSFRPKLLKTNTINFNSKLIRNPKHFSSNILQWLYSYYIYDSDIKLYNIYFLPYDKFITNSGIIVEGESLVYPVIQNGEIVFLQRRLFPNKQIFSLGDNRYPCLLTKSFSNTIILTEDYISAVRCSRTANSMCLFGTNLKSSVVDTVLQYKQILIWLDGDKPGQAAAQKIMNKLCGIIKYRNKQRAFNSQQYKVINIKSTKDPKCYSPTAMQLILKIKDSYEDIK